MLEIVGMWTFSNMKYIYACELVFMMFSVHSFFFREYPLYIIIVIIFMCLCVLVVIIFILVICY